MRRIKHILLGLSLLMGMAIQAQPDLPYPLDTINGKIYYRYTVQRGIGIYRLGLKFEVSQEELLQANPHLLTTGLRIDEEILIPTKYSVAKEIVEENTIAETEPSTEETIAEKDSDVKKGIFGRSRRPTRRSKKAIRDSIALIQQDTICIDTIQNDTIIQDSAVHVIRLAIMLPLYTDAVKRDENMDRFFDFYAGTLLAINEVQAEGQKIEIFSYDVDKTAHTTNLLMQDSTWQRMDAIIGPAYPKQVTAATQYAQRDSSWILVPFLPSVPEIKHNPYVLKFNPSTVVAAEAMANYLAGLGDKVNCVLLEAREGDNVPASIKQLHHALKRHRIPTTTTTIRQIYTDSIDSVFVAGKENIVIFNTENYNNVHTLIPNLLQATKKFQVTLYSQYSWVDKNIAIPQLYTSAFSNSLNVPAAYLATFREYFGHELSSNLPRYDLLGYDLTLHLLRMLQQAHAENTNILPLDTVWNGTQTSIQYKKVSSAGGYENQTIHIIRK